MTRAAIKQLSQGLLREYLGSPTEGDPFTLDLLLDVVTDELAQAGKFYYASVGITTVAGQASYSLPTTPLIFQLTDVLTAKVAGGLRLLTQITPDRMRGLYGADWRNVAASDIGDTTATAYPYAVVEGTGTIVLSPPPSIVRNLTVEGWAIPRGTWAADTAECPLLEAAHEALSYLLAAERCIQYPEAMRAAGGETGGIDGLRARANELRDLALDAAGRFVQGPGMNAAARTRGTDGVLSANRDRAAAAMAQAGQGN